VSPDGWTRELDLEVAVADPDFWNSQADAISQALAFLTTDRWHVRFHPGGALPPSADQPVRPEEDSIVLLSGGLDSLIGGIDLVARRAGSHRQRRRAAGGRRAGPCGGAGLEQQANRFLPGHRPYERKQ